MGTIYKWISLVYKPLYSLNLVEHLRGWDGTESSYIKSDFFSMILWGVVIVTFVACCAYYYVFNSPRWNRLRYWLRFLAVVALVSSVIAFWKSYYDLDKGNISSDLLPISGFACVGFGLAVFIWSMVFFIIYSILIQLVGKFFKRFKSVNCGLIPFNFKK